MDSDGAIVDESRQPDDVTEEHALKMYTDMLTVSIMDLIMFDAQRQGRLSFYMVRLTKILTSYRLISNNTYRYQLEKKA
jgi:TPP-dependent pyruvate/acetoin dehydrogenase alpha subunit